jgi:hypothetical protein
VVFHQPKVARFSGLRHSWTAPVYILSAEPAGIHPADEDQMPLNGNPHPLPGNLHPDNLNFVQPEYPEVGWNVAPVEEVPAFVPPADKMQHGQVGAWDVHEPGSDVASVVSSASGSVVHPVVQVMVAEPMDVQVAADVHDVVQDQVLEEIPAADAGLDADVVLEPVIVAPNVLVGEVAAEEIQDVPGNMDINDDQIVQEMEGAAAPIPMGPLVLGLQGQEEPLVAPGVDVMHELMEEQVLAAEVGLHGLGVEDSLALVPFVPKRSWESAFVDNPHLSAFDGSVPVVVDQRQPWIHASLKNIKIIDNVGGSEPLNPVFVVPSNEHVCPPRVALDSVNSGPFAVGVVTDKKHRGRQKKQKTVVQDGPRRFTRSQLVLDGHRAPVTPALQSRPRKRSKKSAGTQGLSVTPAIPSETSG